MIIWAGTRERTANANARTDWQNTLIAWVVQNIPHNFKARLPKGETLDLRRNVRLAPTRTAAGPNRSAGVSRVKRTAKQRAALRAGFRGIVSV